MPDARYQGWTRNTEVLRPHQFKKQWNSGKTKPIRVPITLAERVLEYARALDDGGDLPFTDNSGDAIATIIAKVKAKEKGYTANSASALIKALKELDVTS